MARVTILADQHIPFVAEAFSTIGDVVLKPGREIGPADVAHADVLVVRTITAVNRGLLEGGRVRFVATATSGCDHIDQGDLAELGIGFYGALGCNANSVAEYMATAWLTLAARRGVALRGRRVGVVGVGHVGSLVAEKARALGMVPVLNDPPKARARGLTGYVPLEALLDCDIVTCHTPLTQDGPDPTWRLIGDTFLSRLKPGAWFCSAGRGEVVDEAALHHTLDAGRIGACVLDVWDHEPTPDGGLIARADIATPHIAGYSLDGKLNGTSMVYRATCAHLGVEPSWDAAAASPAPTVPLVALDATGRADEAVLADVTRAVYPIDEDDARMRATAGLPDRERGAAFDQLRKTYPVRREFGHTHVQPNGAGPDLRRALGALGFSVEEL